MSEQSLAAITKADDNLEQVLRALEEKGARDTTDVVVLSDHGFSTISAMVDLADSLQQAGMNAKREFEGAPAPGDVMVVGDGGSILIYVIGHQAKVVKKVVDFLQGWKCTGVIFTRQDMRGTFTLAQVHEDSLNAPDVVVSLRWTAEKNEAGTPGMVIFRPVAVSGWGRGCTRV